MDTQTRVRGFSTSKSPTGIAQSLENALIALRLLKIDCRYDLFHNRIIVKGYESGLSGDAIENLDNVCLKIRQAVLAKFGFDPGKQHIFDAVTGWALDHVFDPVRDYLDSVRWDGVQGIWIYEIAELEGLTKSEVTKVKLFASKTHDMACLPMVALVLTGPAAASLSLRPTMTNTCATRLAIEVLANQSLQDRP